MYYVQQHNVIFLTRLINFFFINLGRIPTIIRYINTALLRIL